MKTPWFVPVIVAIAATLFAFHSPVALAQYPGCPSDVTLDGRVDGIDTAQLLSEWGGCAGCATDFNDDGVVDGLDLGVMLGGWGICPISIHSVAPSMGPTIGGTTITVIGTSLTGVNSVTIGGAPATSIVVYSSTTLTAVTPAGVSGPSDVVVSTPSASASAPGAFSYIPAPAWATVLQHSPEPTVVTDPVLRAAISATGLPWRVRDNATQIEFVLVPPGTFMMGISPGDSEAGTDESPAHEVMLTAPYYMGRTEVTQAQWTARMGSNPSYHWQSADSPSRPVEGVSWSTVQTFCAATGTRLPTEAEWEFASRAGTTTSRYGAVGDIAWFSGNSSGATHAVAGKAANALGLYDTLGNVDEWTQDFYGAYTGSAVTDPQGPATGPQRVGRGGPWVYNQARSRASERVPLLPTVTDFGLGFRLAKSPQAPAAPTVGSVSPSAGPTVGGTAITISGTALTGATIVTIGGIVATQVSVASPTALNAVTPAGTAGVKSVVVVTPGGQYSLPNAYTYHAAPTISSMSPVVGPTTGGTTITIYGANLSSTSAITIGVLPVASFSVVSASQVTAITPAGLEGGAQLILTTPGGPVAAPGVFTYFTPPVVSSVSPSAGPVAGGTVIAITGTSLIGATSVTVGGAPVTSFSVVSSSSISAVTPAGSAGSKTVTVTTPGGVATASNAFTYHAVPTVTTVSPSTGPVAGGTTLTITGTNLSGTTSVSVGGVSAASFSVVSVTQVTAVTPAGNAGVKNLTLTTPGGVVTVTNAFTYFAIPTIASIAPVSGPAAGGTAFTITGTSFTGTTSVTVGGIGASSVVVASSTSITAVTPAGVPGVATVAVTTPGGAAVSSQSFTFIGLPTISSVGPNGGPPAGGTAITIAGTYFDGASSVTIGGVAASSVVVVSSSIITAVTPANTGGVKSVVVTTPGGTATAVAGFAYLNTPAWGTMLEAAPNDSVVTSAAFRAAIVATGLPWRVIDNATQVEFLLVPPGTFTMGALPSDPEAAANGNEWPQHQVTLTEPFYLARTELTQAQWMSVPGTVNPSVFSDLPDSATRPVESVSWTMVNAFCLQTGMRLPTEAEWEYSCRAGTTASRYGALNSVAWYWDTSNGETHVVGGLQANALGFHDMLGNVYEWCQDWFAAYSAASATNPTGPATGLFRLLRGGGWLNLAAFCRSPERDNAFPDNFGSGIGFRPARTPGVSPPPTIASVSPSTGLVGGGITITITGTFLTGATGVTLAGAAASSVSVVSPTSVTAVTPPGSLGLCSVSVTTPGGQATLPNSFTYTVTTPTWATILEALPDPLVVTDAAHRAAIAATGLAWRVRDNASQIEMVLIPPGSFTIGLSPGDKEGLWDESPAHPVTLTQPFYLARTELTQQRWQALMGSNPSFHAGYTDSPSRPVEQVSWTMVQAFMAATGTRLPTESEWEYACRAGTTSSRYGDLSDIGWVAVNSGNQTHPVGLKPANGFGLYDTLGNVQEWCSDYYWSWAYSTAASTNPMGSVEGQFRNSRGGAYYNSSTYGRASSRGSNTTEYVNSGWGVRVAKSPSASTLPTASAVSVNAGAPSGGTALTITGTQLSGTSSVLVGGVAATITAVTSTTVAIVTPPNVAGSKDVKITTPSGVVTISAGFVYVTVPAWSTLLQAEAPASVVTNLPLRLEIKGTGLAWRVSHNASTIEMVVVPPGTFIMGASPGDGEAISNEFPAHQVTLTNPFYMGRTEVTQAVWLAEMGSNPSYFTGNLQRPVEKVSWNTIQPFLTQNGLRLPTEAEWEYACRAGTTSSRYGVLTDIAWYTSNSGSATHAVATKLPNALGLYDTLGNVWEWNSDWDGSYSAAAVTNPTGPASGSSRLLRGGAWDVGSNFCRASLRYYGLPSYADDSVGLRVARTP